MTKSLSSLFFPRQATPTASPVSLARVSETALRASLWAGVAISLIFLIARIWIRLKVFRRLQPDDPFVLTAWLLALAHAVIWTAVSKELYFNLDLATGRITNLPPDFLQRIERLLRGNLAAYLIGYTSLWSIKISFIVFFRKFGEKLRFHRIAWYVVLGFCVASFAVCIGTVDYRCLTSKGVKMISICMEPRTTSFEFVTLRLTTALDVLTDFSIIFLSTNVLWRVQLRLWTKLALGGIFSLTIFVVIVAIVRVVGAPTNGKLDLSWLVCWHGIELSVALIIVSLASFRILYTSKQQSSRSGPIGLNQGGSDVSKTARSKTSGTGWTELSDASATRLEPA
ncbi:hypothetical protein K458DRAFT_325744 [Lentithecium fluviatile CBS 122367]|uniref:Rhodopsin domain-containing protein n=1 Tax=Lentithecium fluviatile CBS 122367 TaxID=1168545 RepID=A0A6G1JP90_9PLEO|nr:hypothetical protein K458DRAFT_325744 [Lentithecium fluviatile CBS 122367]